MSTDTPDATDADAASQAEATEDADVPGDLAEASGAELREEVAKLRSELSAVRGDNAEKKLTVVATKGTLDMAYPPLILANTAAAFGWDVTVFHTLWGLEVLHEERSKELQMSAAGNPNLPMPNALAALPGMDAVATKLMRRKMDDHGTATVEELVETSIDMGAELQACQMTAEMMDYEEDEFYDGVRTGVGAATALREMADADVQLVI